MHLAILPHCAGLLAGCEEPNRYVPPPPPQVAVANPLRMNVIGYLEETGTLAAVNTVDLVARIPGFVQEIKYKDGAIVKKGTPLFMIEPEPYKVKVGSGGRRRGRRQGAAR